MLRSVAAGPRVEEQVCEAAQSSCLWPSGICTSASFPWHGLNEAEGENSLSRAA